MSKRPQVVAAGGVILREQNGSRQVLLIYRKAYKDWSLPKGKGEPDEYLPETAAREILEETGVTARLDLRLPTIRYNVSKGLKAVHYWRGSVVEQVERAPDGEVQEVRWFDIAEALSCISYDDERQLIRSALESPPTTVLLLARHAKAMLRKNWSGPDQARRLTGRGRSQASELVALFETFGISKLKSSSARRCMDTLKPYAVKHGLKVQGIDLFTEEEGGADPAAVSAGMGRIMKHLSAPTAVCGHRPVLPAMFEGLGLKPRPMVVGEVLAIHVDAEGHILSSDVLKPMA